MIILYRKISILFSFKNNINIDKLPLNAPTAILFILTFLFKTKLTESNSKKSIMKFIPSTISKYTLI